MAKRKKTQAISYSHDNEMETTNSPCLRSSTKLSNPSPPTNGTSGQQPQVYTCKNGPNAGRQFSAVFNPPGVTPRTSFFEWIDGEDKSIVNQLKSVNEKLDLIRDYLKHTFSVELY
jgi:hypothetical protein